MHRMTRLSAGTLLAATALALPANLHAEAPSRTAAAPGNEGAAEHASQRVIAIISNVGREGAAEHEWLRIVSRNQTPS